MAAVVVVMKGGGKAVAEGAPCVRKYGLCVKKRHVVRFCFVFQGMGEDRSNTQLCKVPGPSKIMGPRPPVRSVNMLL